MKRMPLVKFYTVSRCTAKDKLYGPTHWSADGVMTFCGADISTGDWWVLSSTFRGKEATCKKCIKAVKLEGE